MYIVNRELKVVAMMVFWFLVVVVVVCRVMRCEVSEEPEGRNDLLRKENDEESGQG